MEFIILFVLAIVIIGFFLSGGILFVVSKLFKIENLSYKKSLIVSIVSLFIGIITLIIFNIINLNFIGTVLGGIITFFVFHYFYKKYYQATLGKSLKIYIVSNIIISILIIISAIIFRFYFISPFVINFGAMSPTYNNGDYVLVNKFNKNFSRGDIIVFQYKKEQKTFFLVERIIGLPSEKIEIQNGKIFINNELLNETYYNRETEGDISTTLGAEQYFVLGDNRNNSFDSRNFGPIIKSDIEGKVFYKVLGLTTATNNDLPN